MRKLQSVLAKLKKINRKNEAFDADWILSNMEEHGVTGLYES